MEFWKLIVSYYSDLQFYNLSSNNTVSLLYFVGAFGIAGIWTIFAAFITKRRTGRIVDPLLKRQAVDPASAISPAEGGFNRQNLLLLLKRGSMLRKTVEATEPEGESEEASLPTNKGIADCLSRMRFYIPENKRDMAKRRYSAQDANIPSLIVSVIIILVFTVVVYFFLPVILRMVDNFITMTGGN